MTLQEYAVHIGDRILDQVRKTEPSEKLDIASIIDEAKGGLTKADYSPLDSKFWKLVYDHLENHRDKLIIKAQGGSAITKLIAIAQAQLPSSAPKSGAKAG